MPCAECGSDLIIVEDYPTCPSCEHIGLVPQDDSVRIMQSVMNEVREKLMRTAAAYDPNRILEVAFSLQELTVRNLLQYGVLDLEALIGATGIIKLLLQTPRPPAGRQADVDGAARLIKSYAALLSAQDNLDNLRAGTYSMIHMAKYDPNNLRGLRTVDFPLYPREKYAPVVGILTKHGIMTKAAAARKIQEMDNLEPVEFGSKRFSSLEHAISTFYRGSSMLSMALGVSRTRREIFALPDGRGIPVTFLELRQFIGNVPAFREGVTWCHASYFERMARDQFGDRYASFSRNFVAGRDNPLALPIFLNLEDRVYTSNFFGDLYCYVALPTLHKQKFDLETMHRGKAYERIVQAYLKQRGFKYIPNIKEKDQLEIDGIAVSKEIAYVVEAKCWSSKPLIGDPAYLVNMEQRIRGAIDGVQHERKTGKTKRVGVPLPLKVEWVLERKRRFGIGAGTEVKGLLVINTASSLSEHGGCDIAFVDDFESKLLQEGCGDDRGGVSRAGHRDTPPHFSFKHSAPSLQARGRDEQGQKDGSDVRRTVSGHV